MSIAKGIEFLERERTLAYEYNFPIHTIERMIQINLVSVSEPYRKWDARASKWRMVKDVSLKFPLGDRA